jgi:Ca2+-binding RTX toxin-like protein
VADTGILDAEFADVANVETLQLFGASTAVLGTESAQATIATVTTGTGATDLTTTVAVSMSVVSNVADGVALSLAGDDVNYSVTTLVGDLTVADAHSGNVSVTTGAVATTTVALGTNTTGTKTVDGDLLADTQVLTLTGSDAATVTLVAGDLAASSYVGALDVDTTTGSNVVSTGSAGDNLNTGGGDDIIDGGGGSDVIIAGAGNDTIKFDSIVDLEAVTSIDAGGDTDIVEFTAGVTLVDSNIGNAAVTAGSLETLSFTGANTITLGANSNTAGVVTVDTGVGVTSVTATVAAAITVASDVADDTALSLDGDDVNYTVTGLLGDLTVSDTHTGNVAVTTGAVATITVALGSNTTGTKAVTANALTDTQVLTLTGADAANVNLVAGDLSAGTYTGNLTVVATSGTNVITTNSGADTITGGSGLDNVTAGSGDDVIIVAAVSDIISSSTETIDGGTGTDTLSITAAGTYDFSTGTNNITNVEVISIASDTASYSIKLDKGMAATSDLGSTNSGQVRIEAAQTMAGSNGVTIDARDLTGTETITLNDSDFAGADVIYGGVAADYISTYAGNDSITGGGGADTIAGGAGDDRVIFTSVDQMTVAGTDIGGGADTDTLEINAGSSSFALDETGLQFVTGFENLHLSGSGAQTVNLANSVESAYATGMTITTTGSSLVVDGGTFNKVLTATGTTGRDNLTGGTQNDSLVGGDNRDTLSGGDGNDTLNGGDSADSLVGGNGNDSIIGGDGSDNIQGGAGADVIDAGDGADTVLGGDGIDNITLGAGADILKFDSTDAVDVITDYSSSDDVIQLDILTFDGFSATGAISSGQILVGAGVTAATDTTQRLIYDTTADNLYYDADGSGGVAAVQIATFNDETLSAAEFVIV